MSQASKYYLERLSNSGWDKNFESYLNSKDFQNAIEFLVAEKKARREVTPLAVDLFKAFELCSKESLRVVFVGQD